MRRCITSKTAKNASLGGRKKAASPGVSKNSLKKFPLGDYISCEFSIQ